ncbi:hypothetical protein [Clostridium tyrobutyricum]|uniref:hypothetical protein n=1 Tax=Clostridium tyrobutyricum TaxID=1519 RepID=UPI001C393C47|nr:hypothetical protein [Clostridium tyrobutyricum]MBV4417317.1 hypothetical protein [Clostridium tyrobutyricum]
MNISFEKACNIINDNEIDRVYCVEESKEKDCGKPKSKGAVRSTIVFFECGDIGDIKSIAPMIAIKEDMISKITFGSQELIFDINNNTKYRVAIS